MGFRHLISCLLSIAVLFFYLPFAKAGTTKLISIKVDDQYEGGYLKSVMVVAMAEKPKNRGALEDAFVKEYQKGAGDPLTELPEAQRQTNLDFFAVV